MPALEPALTLYISIPDLLAALLKLSGFEELESFAFGVPYKSAEYPIYIHHVGHLHGPEQEIQIHRVGICFVVESNLLVERSMVKVGARIVGSRRSAQQIDEAQMVGFIDAKFLPFLVSNTAIPN